MRTRVVLVLACVFTGSLWAQRTTGSLVGIVHDSSAAAVPNAEIMATNLDTGLVRKTATESGGNYRVMSLPPGRYRLSAEAAGFKKATRDAVELQVDQDLRLDFTLEVGDVRQEVTITATAPGVNTESGSIGNVLNTTKMRELPVRDRNPFWLAALTPGVTGDGNNLNVNGSRAMQQEVLVDGGTLVLPARGNFNEGMPVIDGIDELKLQTNAYSAEFGRGASVINATTKGGTNQFHGGAYEFFRNDKLNANGFFNNKYARRRPIERRNVYGANLGGPIRRDKTFFSFLWDVENQRTPVTNLTNVPTAAMKAGDFSAPGLPVLYDPSTSRFDAAQNRYVRQVLPGNVVPANRIDPVARKLMTYIPEPNFGAPGAFAQNMLMMGSNSNIRPRYQPRIDHKFSDKHFMFGRLNLQQSAQEFLSLWAGDSPADPNRRTQGRNMRHFTFSDTYLLSTRLVNDFRASYWRGAYPMSNPSMFKDYAGQLGLRNSTPNRFPAFAMQGLGSFNAGGADSLDQVEDTRHASEAMTYVHGQHSLKWGADYRWLSNSSSTGRATASGSFTFNGVFTRNLVTGRDGLGLADALLGIPSGYSITTADLRFGARRNSLGWYIQDDWKMGPRLTVNFGVRGDMEFGAYEAHDRWANFDPSVINPFNNRPGALVFAGENGAPRNFAGRKLGNIAPRFGLAWTPFGDMKTVIRAGGGVFYVPMSLWGDFGGRSGLGYTKTASATVTDQVTPAFTLQQGPPAPKLDVRAPELGVGQSVAWVMAGEPTPVSYQYNFTIGRQLPGSVNLEASYVGQRGVHLHFKRQINQLRAEQLGPGDITPRRPWPQYTGVQPYFFDATSTYHSFQLKIDRAYSNGASWTVAYTAGKSLDNSSDAFDGDTIQNAYDLRSTWGLSAFDVSQNLVTNFTYQLPFGPGRAVALEGWKAKVLGGWQINGLSFMRGGTPFTPTMNVNTATAGANAQYPNRLSSGKLSKPTIEQWFDTAAFVSPGQYRFGNSGRNILRGDGPVTFDASLFKNTYFSTPLNERTNVQFRVEAFNFFNFVNFSNPNASVGSSTYGTVTGTSIAARSVQLALKLLF